jgi:hypothetical protein
MALRRRSTASVPTPQRRTGNGYAGFCLAGYMSPASNPEQSQHGIITPEAVRVRIAQEARLTRSMGGNLLRNFWSLDSIVVGPPEQVTVAINTALRPDFYHRNVFRHIVEHRVDQLDLAWHVLDQLLMAVADDPRSEYRLDFSSVDALFDGLDDANSDGEEPVLMMLTLVTAPPRWIIESPSDATLTRMARGYSFGSLWDRYIRFHTQVYRRIVARYTAGRPVQTLRALEIFNEPDYNWTPEEVKIEGAGEGLVNPLGKYVTELQLPQVPVNDRSAPPFQPTEWGFAPQDANWNLHNRPSVGVLDFDWGPKFDWYVMCAAQFQAHTSRAIKEEAQKLGVEMLTVSGSVTHNNIDYLVRMHRGDHAAFQNIDRIGLHPYHWINNDVWDDQFVRSDAVTNWAAADPREFAMSYLKRFDFLTATAGHSGDAHLDEELQAVFAGRELWLTEFGIGSKVVAGHNASVPDHTRFIRPREIVGGSAGYQDVVWEDLWQSFLDQVDADWLAEHGVECVLIYGLRELAPGYDLHDADRSNLSVFHSDGTPRLGSEQVEQLARLMSQTTGRPSVPALTSTNGTTDAVLYRRPWRSITLSPAATDVKTMLSIEERQLLFWLASSYFRGEGAIVDGGCFLGGSTIPLGEGLEANPATGTIDVYDQFEIEPYMNDMYFQGESRASGSSFRPVFERNIAHVAEHVRIHEGDLMTERWHGGPIEILFVDLSKTWELNDLIVDQFFPSLIPGRSVLVQQDFVFAICPWVPLTMEYLADHFEPVGFAEYCSVVYATRSPVPSGLDPVSALPHDRQIELMDTAIDRFCGYPRDVLECAKAMLFVNQGDFERADAIVRRLSVEGTDHFSVKAALEHVARYR